MKTIKFEITEKNGEEIISCFTNNKWDMLSKNKQQKYIEEIKDIINKGYPKEKNQ